MDEVWASPHFKWNELRCRGCSGECSYSVNGKPVVNVEDAALAKLENLRVAIGKPFTPNCASRCPLHNVRVGGAPLSQHRATVDVASTAFDLPLMIPKAELIKVAEAVGFNGIGVNYKTFVHVDNRARRARW